MQYKTFSLHFNS